MAEGPISCVSCQIVYGDPFGECHLQLPVFVDGAGACHVSLSAASDIQDPDEAGRVLSHICLGTCQVADEARRERLRLALGKALAEDTCQQESSHRRFLRATLARLDSYDRHSTEAKDALRKAVISERRSSAGHSHEKEAPHPRTCFLSYLEQAELMTSH
jgi:hypothetical protein